MNYSVGQILYAVFKKDNKIIPIQVVEEITRKTIDGLRIDYTVQAGADPSSSLPLSTLSKEVEIFNSPEQTVETLAERAKKTIAKMVQSATAKSENWYGVSNRTESVALDMHDEVIPVSSHTFPEQENVTVTLPDGTIARVRLPQVS